MPELRALKTEQYNTLWEGQKIALKGEEKELSFKKICGPKVRYKEQRIDLNPFLERIESSANKTFVASEAPWNQQLPQLRQARDTLLAKINLLRNAKDKQIDKEALNVQETKLQKTYDKVANPLKKVALRELGWEEAKKKIESDTKVKIVFGAIKIAAKEHGASWKKYVIDRELTYKGYTGEDSSTTTTGTEKKSAVRKRIEAQAAGADSESVVLPPLPKAVSKGTLATQAAGAKHKLHPIGPRPTPKASRTEEPLPEPTAPQVTAGMMIPKLPKEIDPQVQVALQSSFTDFAATLQSTKDVKTLQKAPAEKREDRIYPFKDLPKSLKMADAKKFAKKQKEQLLGAEEGFDAILTAMKGKKGDIKLSKLFDKVEASDWTKTQIQKSFPGQEKVSCDELKPCIKKLSSQAERTLKLCKAIEKLKSK